MQLFTRRNNLDPSLASKLRNRPSGVFRRNVELTNLRDGLGA